MTTDIKSNGSKWAGQRPDSLDTLEDRLRTYVLDASVAGYGDYLPGQRRFHGNFLKYSGVFDIRTDEPAVIARLTGLMDANMQRPDYLAQLPERLYETPSGLGGTFPVKVTGAAATYCSVRVHMPKNPDWDGYEFDTTPDKLTLIACPDDPGVAERGKSVGAVPEIASRRLRELFEYRQSDDPAQTDDEFILKGDRRVRVQVCAYGNRTTYVLSILDDVDEPTSVWQGQEHGKVEDAMRQAIASLPPVGTPSRHG